MGFSEIAIVVEYSRIDLETRRLAVLFSQLRFGVKTVYLGYSAVHVEEDDALSLGGKVGRSRIQGRSLASRSCCIRPDRASVPKPMELFWRNSRREIIRL